MKDIVEGSVIIRNETAKIVTKEMGVFYNPIMKHNRDMMLLVLACEKNMQCCDLMAGSGIRTIRALKELPEGCIEHITINDYDPKSVKRIETNLKQNGFSGVVWFLPNFLEHSKIAGPGSREQKPLPRIIISNLDASQLLNASNGYDYIDIDPFGSPNPFLDAACKRISRNGILAVTATDTSALAGSYPDACKRKYWANPCDGPRMHEVGLRILIRKVQLIGAQYDKALTPILCYNKDHYYRCYFRAQKGKKKCDMLLAQHGSLTQEDAGPLWLGELADPKSVRAVREKIPLFDFSQKEREEYKRFLQAIEQENTLKQPPFYHFLNDVNKQLLQNVNKPFLLELLGKNASVTHHTRNAIKSTFDEKTIIQHVEKARRKKS